MDMLAKSRLKFRQGQLSNPSQWLAVNRWVVYQDAPKETKWWPLCYTRYLAL